jgi:hypothetical protein
MEGVMEYYIYFATILLSVLAIINKMQMYFQILASRMEGVGVEMGVCDALCTSPMFMFELAYYAFLDHILCLNLHLEIVDLK